MFDCAIHLIRVSWTGHIRKWRLSSRDISSEWRKTVEERGGGESRTKDFCAANVAGAELPEREVVDMMATLLCSFDGMESKIDNGHCFGPATVSSRKKKSHAESTQINHPSAARSSEHRMQIFSTMLDAIEEVCVSVLRHVFSACRAWDDADSAMQHSSQIYYRWRPLPSAHLHMWPARARAFHMRAHSQSKCCAHSKCRALSQRPHCASGQTCPPTCSPPSPYTHVETAHLLTHHRTGFAARLPEQIHCSLAPLGEFHTFHSGVANPARRLHMLASTKNSYIGCAATSCSASPHGGLYIWRSNSVLRAKGRHSPHGIF